MNDKKTSEQVMREGLEDIVFFSQGCYASEYFANIAKKALEESDRLKLSIPRKIADALDVGDLMILAWTHANDLLGKVSDEERKSQVICRSVLARAYLAGKALGVELVEVTDE